MAKRRRLGNKKRRDVQRDSSALRRVAKVGMVAAGVAVGGSKLMQSQMGQKLIKSGAIEEALKTGKNFKRELLNKPKNFRTLKDAYNKHIGKNGEHFKQRVKNRELGKITKTKLGEKITYAEQQMHNTLRFGKTEESTFNPMKQLIDKATAGLSDDRKVKVRDAISALYMHATEENVENGTLVDHYKTLKKSGFDDSQVETMLKEILESKKNNIVDNDYIANTYGNMSKKLRSEYLRDNVLKKENFLDKVVNALTGSRALTIQDVKDMDLDIGDVSIREFYSGEGDNKKFGQLGRISLKDRMINNLHPAFNGEYSDVIVDRGLRVITDKDGNKQIVDYRDTAKTLEKWFEKASDTMPGKILLKPLDLGKKQDINFLHSGMIDANGALTGGEDNILQNPMFAMGDKIYNILKDGNGEAYYEQVKGVKVQQVTGWREATTHELLGGTQQALEANDGWLSKMLDINQDGSFNIKKTLGRILDNEVGEKLGLGTDPEWEKNKLRKMKEYMNSTFVIDPNDTKTKSYMYDSAKITSVMMNKNITGVSDELMDNLINSGKFSETENQILEMLLDGSAESMNNVIETLAGVADSGQLKNKRLRQLIETSLRNVEDEKTINHISMKKTRMNILFGMPLEENWYRDDVGQFRVEFVKEIMMQREDQSIRMADIIADNDTQRKTLRDISMLGLFESYMDLDGIVAPNVDNRFTEIGSKSSRENQFRQLLHSNISLRMAFNDIMDESIDEFSSLGISYMGSLNETNLYSEFNKASYVRKSAFNAKDIIETINTAIKGGTKDDYIDAGKSILGTMKELGLEMTVGGRYDTEHLTTATLTAQYAMSRLNFSLNEFGLGLSQDSMSSPLATYLNFGLKRVMPVALGVGTFSYLNDESRRFFGSSITEAAARGASYADMGFRKAAYGINIPGFGSLGQRIDAWEQTSVIAEYWTGSNHFDTAEERAEWYENGYSPVRKGRFWSFGSSSEYRGGAISYWQPNYLRRAESNYHDISVYGSSEEKWAHSWIPTPTHPLSTIRALMDPYWLEKKHLKEGDRPYPLTSKLFTEGTPWGAVLNPTVGEILKPVRMLPEVRLRLGSNGRDSKAVINRINERIKSKEQQNEDLIIVSGTDVRNAEYVPFGQPTPGEVNFTVRNGTIEAPGYNFMETLPNMGEYAPPEGMDYVQSVKGGGQVLIGGKDGIISSKFLDGMTNQGDTGYAESIGKGLISNINAALKSGSGRSAGISNDSSKSTYIYRNLVNEYNNYVENWYSERHDPTMVRSRQYDLMRDAMYSTGQISGMYGYLGRLFTGSRDSFTFRYESAEQMNSFSRTFWDASIGGIGWGPMEIARRFFPSEDKNRINVNPLVNNMPDWIPDSYRTGDPFTKIPKGEARLPGKGYEALNDLHPDQFGDYGAFDRYKILADIAPNSAEYKKWRNIAKATVTDQDLKSEMRDISERVSKMSGNHEFFEYKYLKNSTQYSKGIVKSISGSNIVLTDNTIISLAGVEGTDETVYGIQSQLSEGQEITYRHEKNKTYSKENPWNNYTTSAVVYVNGSPTSLNKSLIDSGYAMKDVEDNSVIAQLGRISPGQEAAGAFQEFIAHAPIPIVHNKFLRVDSAYESYMKETYYGSNFKTWDHPIKGFVAPMFNEQSSKSVLGQAVSMLVAQQHFSKFANSTAKVNIKGFNVSEKWLSNLALVTTNPTAFLFGNASYILNMANGGKGSGQELSNWQRGAKFGVAVGTAKWAWDNADNPFKAMGSMALAGAYVGAKDLAWDALSDAFKDSTAWSRGGKGALIGAGVGLAISLLKNQDFDKEKMFGKWAPKNTRKKWELDEYFDRLEYIKYSGLYERAAALARRKEGVDIEGIFEQIDENKEKIAKLNRKAAKLMNKMDNPNDKYGRQLAQIDAKKQMLEEQSQMMFEGGEYTKSAIAYKKAMESTMYGLDPTATMDELLASVPDQYKDHFQAFMNVTDKKEQEKILKSVSPMMRRPLQAAWGMKLERVKSNRRYFKVHALPGAGWRGWRPNVNLKHVKMKTIRNEGMLLSEFGYYDSEKAKTSFEDAPDIENYNEGTFLSALKVRTVMKGHGLHVRNVSVEKSRAPGIRIVGDVKERVEDRTDATMYRASQIAYKLGSLF